MGNHESQVHSDPKVDIQKRHRLKDQCNYNHLPSQGTDVGLMKQKAADAKKLKENAHLISYLRSFRSYSVFQRSVTMKVTSPGFTFKRMQWNYGISITPGHYCTPPNQRAKYLFSVAMIQTTFNKTPVKPEFLLLVCGEKHLLQSGYVKNDTFLLSRSTSYTHLEPYLKTKRLILPLINSFGPLKLVEEGAVGLALLQCFKESFCFHQGVQRT